MRALSSLPLTGTDENLAVLLALVAMKLVNRHGNRIVAWQKISSCVFKLLHPPPAQPEVDHPKHAERAIK
jgi:hypothetical protein